MGVPALFRWLSRKYPKIISPVVEEDTTLEIGAAQYSDANPNGEVDNLYLDMNGIVHPCFHPENRPPPETEDEMFLEIFRYTDRVLMMARPRKVLMIAVDGVAPRAKMNQQRARRFRAAKDAKLAQEEKERQIREKELRGEFIDDAIKGKKSWDSNSITPGTPFMDKLAQALRYWVAYKLANDPGWANLQVIISDATVPGEGEHKLMKFIRAQRADPQYDPNTKHCIYGLDADLIFLGLATHEPHFRVLREDVFANQTRRLNVSDHLSMTQEQKDALAASDAKKPFLWLHVNILREYLEVELYNSRLSFPFDLERAIDDWVFMCFFVGNDFLPHLPSLDVRDNGIDILVGCWKRILPQLKGYITCDGNLNLQSVERLMKELSAKEDDIFRKRYENERRREDSQKRRKVFQEEEKALRNQYIPALTKGKDKAPLAADTNMPLMTTSGEVVEGYAKFSNSDIVNNLSTINKANLANADAAAKLKKLIEAKSSDNVSAVQAVNTIKEDSSSKKRELEDDSEASTPTVVNNEESTNSESDDSNDAVRMWEPGYHRRYYTTKFHISTDEEINEQKKSLVRSYLEGISWVLLYYYQGCPSWKWFFPFHYAPFAQDFVDVESIVGNEGIKFTPSIPFRPFEQLMSVMPASSSHTLPDEFAPLMKDPSSDIIHFYPEEFEIDMNGAKMSWQGIPLLPFIDEELLLAAVEKVYEVLSPEEIERNTNKEDVLYVSRQGKAYDSFASVYKGSEAEVIIRPKDSGLSGQIKKCEGFELEGTTRSPLKEGGLPTLDNAEFLPVTYNAPYKTHGKSMLLNGYISHEPALRQEDIDAIQYGGRGGPNNRFRSPNDNRDYVNKGPQGKKLFMVYANRRGGFRSFAEASKRPKQNDFGGNYNQRSNNNINFNNRYDQSQRQNYNQNYNQNQGYNNQYNANYGQRNQGYNKQFNQGYNQGYNNQGYNQGYNNQGYNQGYNQGHNNDNNYGHNSGYQNQGQNYNSHYQNARSGPPPRQGRNGYRR